MFDGVLHRVGPRIQKSDTNFRKALETCKYLDRFVTMRPIYACTTTLMLWLQYSCCGYYTAAFMNFLLAFYYTFVALGFQL